MSETTYPNFFSENYSAEWCMMKMPASALLV